MHEWLRMGGYAAFVWGSYAVALLGLIGLTVWTVIGHARASRSPKIER